MLGADLLRSLERITLRLKTVCAFSGAGWALACMLLVVVLAAWSDLLWEMPGWVRLMSLISAVVLGIGILVAMIYRGWRQGTPRFMARRLDHVAGTGGIILTGTDLVLEQQPNSSLTAELAQLAIQKAGSVAQTVKPSAVVPAKPIQWSWGSLMGLGLIVLLVALVLPRLAWTQWNRFSDPFGDQPGYSRVNYHVKPGHVKVIYGQGFDISVSTEGPAVDRVDVVLQSADGKSEEVLPMFPEANSQWQASITQVITPGQYFVRSRAGRSERFRIDVITVPKIESVRFRIAMPEYTNLPAYEGALPKEGVSGLAGTQVQVWVKSNRPLSGGSMELLSSTGKQAWRMQATQPGSTEATGTFTIQQAGKLNLQVEDDAKQLSTDVFSASVNLLVDERPFVRILEPRELSYATPNTVLPIAISAEDDYGISRLQLFRSLNESRAMPYEFAVKKPAPLRCMETYQMPLSTYGLEPGDEIKLFARVEDNDPAGPKGSESTVVVIRIIAQQDFEKMVRQRQGLDVLLSKYQQAQRRMENLLEEIEKIEQKSAQEDREVTQEERQELEKLAEQIKKEAEAIEAAAKHELPYDVDKAMSKELEKMAEQLQEASKEAKSLSNKPGLKSGAKKETLKKMREKMAGQKKELQEKTTEPLEHMAKVYPLLQDAERFVELYQRQKDLAARMESLKGKERPDDPALKNRMRDLQAEQLELRQALVKLMDDIDDHIAQLPDDEQLNQLRETATDFLAALRASGAVEAMDQSESSLGAFQGTAASEATLQARDIMEKLLKKCKGGDGMASQCKGCLKFSPSLNECLGNTLDQLLSEAGLGSGDAEGSQPGNGSGNGGGYSARRNSSQNVGLYGQLPSIGDVNSSGRSQGSGLQGLTGRGAGGKRDVGNTRSFESVSKSGSAGVAGAVVPAPYRKRVADYFQRIADETGTTTTPRQQK